MIPINPSAALHNAHSSNRIDRSAFYPVDPQLQAAAASRPLPAGFDAPFFESSSGSGLSLSAYAAIERQVAPPRVWAANWTWTARISMSRRC